MDASNAMNSATILIVEDNPNVADCLDLALTDMDMKVAGVASSGEQALEMVAAFHPTLVLMDVGLAGGIDGIDTAMRLREQFNVPVVYLTASTDHATLERAKATQPLGYLAKPFQEASLRSTLTVALHQIELQKRVWSTERALRESEERYRLTFERAAVGIYHIDGDLRILHANPRLCEMTGYAAEELAQMSPAMLVHPEDYPSAGLALHGLFAKELPSYTVENRWIRKDGRVIWVRSSSSLQRGAEGHPEFAITVVDDITARREAEEKFRLISEQALVSIAIVQDHRVVFANQAASDLHEYPPEDTSNWSRSDSQRVVHPDDLDLVLKEMLRAREGGATVCRCQYRLVTRLGRIKWVDHFSRVVQHGGRPAELVMLVDVTERKRAEEELERRVSERTAELVRASHARDEFLASMSHELRTPLNAVLGFSESLQEEIYGPLVPKQRTALNHIQASGRQLLALITDILDLSRIDAGAASLEFQPVAVADVCRSSIQWIQNEATRRRHTVTLSIGTDVTTIRADGRRLKQMLVKLLDNAVKFTSEGGEIGLQVALDDGGQAMNFTVQDNGMGIEPRDQPRLFQRFGQLDGSLARRFGGVGLGLVLVQRLANLHGGRVAVESQPGLGSRFSVFLPVQGRDETRV